jgi:hypothetical protein
MLPFRFALSPDAGEANRRLRAITLTDIGHRQVTSPRIKASLEPIYAARHPIPTTAKRRLRIDSPTSPYDQSRSEGFDCAFLSKVVSASANFGKARGLAASLFRGDLPTPKPRRDSPVFSYSYCPYSGRYGDCSNRSCSRIWSEPRKKRTATSNQPLRVLRPGAGQQKK